MVGLGAECDCKVQTKRERGRSSGSSAHAAHRRCTDYGTTTVIPEQEEFTIHRYSVFCALGVVINCTPRVGAKMPGCSQGMREPAIKLSGSFQWTPLTPHFHTSMRLAVHLID